jgi:integrase
MWMAEKEAKKAKIRGGYWRESKHGGAWYYDFYIRGKRYGPKSLGNISRTLAQEKVDNLKANIRNGTYEDKLRNGMTFLDFLPLYLESAGAKNKPSTMTRYRMTCALFRSLPELFNRPLHGINVQVLDRFIAHRKSQDRSNGTINRELTLLGGILRKAQDYEYITKLPKIELLKYHSQRNRFLIGDEEERLLKHSGPKLREVIVFALNTGMRQGEILSLTWKNIDFERNLIFVENTKNSLTRYIPMNKLVKELLLAKYMSRSSDDSKVFNYRNANGLRIAFWWATKHARVEGFRFHDLRHTFASRLVMKGAHIRTIQELLGHKSLAMTQRYSHLANVTLSNAVEMLENL